MVQFYLIDNQNLINMELVKSSDEDKQKFIYEVVQFVHNGSGISVVVKPFCEYNWDDIDYNKYYGYGNGPKQYQYLSIYKISIVPDFEIPAKIKRDNKLNSIGI